MSFKSLMAQVVNVFQEAKTQSQTAAQLYEAVSSLRASVNAKNEKGKYVYLARERFAIHEAINTLYDHCATYDLTLVYHYMDDRYSVRTDDVPGCKKAEALISQQLPQDVWDSMPRSTVWRHSGKKFDDCK